MNDKNTTTKTEAPTSKASKVDPGVELRRKVSSKLSSTGSAKGEKHPFGVRNRHIIAARKAARLGKMDESKKALDAAEAIAPLSQRELAGLAKASLVAFPQPPKAKKSA